MVCVRHSNFLVELPPEIYLGIFEYLKRSDFYRDDDEEVWHVQCPYIFGPIYSKD